MTPAPRLSPFSTANPIGTIFGSVGHGMWLAATSSLWLDAVFCLLIVSVMARVYRAIRWAPIAAAGLDPVRRFSGVDRAAIFSRAGARCERHSLSSAGARRPRSCMPTTSTRTRRVAARRSRMAKCCARGTTNRRPPGSRSTGSCGAWRSSELRTFRRATAGQSSGAQVGERLTAGNQRNVPCSSSACEGHQCGQPLITSCRSAIGTVDGRQNTTGHADTPMARRSGCGV